MSGRRELIFLVTRGLLAWLALSLFGWRYGDRLVEAAIPLIDMTMRLLAPELAPALHVVKGTDVSLIHLSAWVVHPLRLTEGLEIGAGRELSVNSHVMHNLVPVIIELTILMAWPVRRWAQRLALLLAGLAVAPLLVAAITPALLVGLVEIQFQQAVQQLGKARPEPWVLSWMIFCETGGRWMLPILAAWGCIQLQRRFVRDSL